LAEAPWIDSAAIAFLAHEAGCVVATLTGEALPPLHTCTGYQRAGVVLGTSREVHQRLLEVITAHTGA
jgi:fructose-1,6-bisphosphatase/inositol monophosphatase family enzyme